MGELGCAYADGCFTAEEMILSAYSRGLVSLQTPFIRGSMAAVGIGYQQVLTFVIPSLIFLRIFTLHLWHIFTTANFFRFIFGLNAKYSL